MGSHGAGIFASEYFTKTQSIMRVPLSTMPIISDFEVTVRNDSFCIKSNQEVATEVQREVMALVIEYYNQTNALSAWRASSPWLSLSTNQRILNQLLKARETTKKSQELLDLLELGKKDLLLSQTFLTSRQFNLLEPQQLAADRSTPYKPQKVLLPIIDLFNHDMSANGFQIQAQSAQPSMRVFGRPDPETREIFVRYNLYDPVDTYLYYGFVDERAPYLSSVALDLECQGRSFDITATGGLLKGKIADGLKDLRIFLPVISKTDRGLTLSKLIIPGEAAPRALRRVLALALRQLDLTNETLRAEVLRIEAEVIERNREYWKEMQDLAAPLEESHALHALCRTALSRIDRYSSTIMGKDL